MRCQQLVSQPCAAARLTAMCCLVGLGLACTPWRPIPARSSPPRTLTTPHTPCLCVVQSAGLAVWTSGLERVIKLLPVDCLLDLIDFLMTQCK